MSGHRRALEAIYAELPDVPCKGLCFGSCSFIAMSEAEHQRIRKEGGVAIEMHHAPCPALDFAGRCSVHELRPLICRLYGATPALRCPHGCKPSRWLTNDEVADLIDRLDAIAGPHEREAAAVIADLLNRAKAAR